MFTLFLQTGGVVSIFSGVLEFLNTNQGFFSLLLSLMLLIAYVAQYISLRRQREILQRQTRLSHRPNVIIDKWYITENTIFFELSNIGNGSAQNIEVAQITTQSGSNTEGEPEYETNEKQLEWFDLQRIRTNRWDTREGGEISEEVIGRNALRAGETGVTMLSDYTNIMSIWLSSSDEHMIYQGFEQFREHNLDADNTQYEFQIFLRYENTEGKLVEENRIWSQEFNLEDARSMIDIVKPENIQNEDPSGTISPQNLNRPKDFY